MAKSGKQRWIGREKAEGGRPSSSCLTLTFVFARNLPVWMWKMTLAQNLTLLKSLLSTCCFSSSGFQVASCMAHSQDYFQQGYEQHAAFNSQFAEFQKQVRITSSVPGMDFQGRAESVCS